MTRGAGLVLIVGLAAGGLWWVSSGSSAEGLGPWKLMDGSLRRAGDVVVADTGATLRDGERTLRLDPGSRLRVNDGDDLPELETGSGELVHPEWTLAIGPGSLVLLKGRLDLDGVVYWPGQEISPGELVPSPIEIRPEIPDVRPEVGATGPRVTGRVLDARDWRPLSGVEIVATHSHFDDGYPPLPGATSRMRVVTDGDGRYVIPVFEPADPRVKLHLEVAHPGYAPEVHVIEAPADADGEWPFTTIQLRQAETYVLEFLGPRGEILPELAISSVRPPFSRRRFLGEDSWDEGRTLRADRPRVRYTDPAGRLRVAFQPRTRSLLDSRLYVWDRREAKPSAIVVTDSNILEPEPEEVRIVHTRVAPARRYALRDRTSQPIAGELIEVSLDGMAPVRLYTGPEGEFEFGPRPYSTGTSRVTFDRPRAGQIMVLSPRLYRHTHDVALPAIDDVFYLNGRIGSGFTLRLVELDDDDLPHPVPANQVEIDRDMTLVLRTEDGQVAFDGTLPRAASNFDLRVRGYEPVVLSMPATAPGTRVVDFGDVVVSRGQVVPVRLTGGSSELYERARLSISSFQDPEAQQSYAFDDDGRVLVGGLTVRRRYRYALEGSRIRRVEGEFVAFEEVIREGIAIPVQVSDEVETRVQGRVIIGDTDDIRYYRVVERFYLEGEDEPVSCVSYPLPSDLRIGSVRVLERPYRVEVFIHGPNGSGAYEVREQGPGRHDFDIGTLEIGRTRSALFRFFVNGLGSVLPPSGLSLFAERNLYHEVAGFHTDEFGRLVVSYLRPGRYVLRWDGGDLLSDAHVFVMASDVVQIREFVERRAVAVEHVEVDLEDRKGKPVVGATLHTDPPRGDIIQPGAPDRPGVFERPPGTSIPFLPDPSVGLPPGHYRVRLYTQHENTVAIAAPEFLPARVTLPPRVGFEDPVVMRKEALLEAQVRDLEGYPFEGRLQVSWRGQEPLGSDEIRVEHGVPLVVNVEGGRLLTGGIPPGERTFVFRPVNSEAKAQKRLQFTEGGRADAGLLQLEEGRSLRGIVELPDGNPAAHAIVALVPPRSAFQFPQRTTNLLAQRYSTRADALGRYTIEGLPLDFRDELALVAHLEGWTDAIETPVDLGILDHRLVLENPTELELLIGYGDRQRHPEFEFRMEFFDGIEEKWRDVGPMAVPTPDARFYTGISPGYYRLTWNLKDAHPDIVPLVAEAEVRPSRRGVLRLFVSDTFISGTARLNGEVVDEGWILMTVKPGDPDALRVGRIRGGEFVVPVESRARRHYAAVVPRRHPIPRVDLERGEALPLPVDIPTSGPLSLSYEAYDVTFTFDANLLARHPDLEIEYQHYAFRGSSYRTSLRRERVGGVSFDLNLVQPGEFPYRIIVPGRWSRSGVIAIQDDTRFPFRK